MNIYERLVKRFTTQQATAEALGVKQATVSGWVNEEHGMSAVVAMRTERITDGEFLAVDLCPALKRVSEAA